MTHKPVLLKEVIDCLRLEEGLVVLDATVNRAGHSKEIAKLIGSTGTLIGLDKDGEAINDAKRYLSRVPCKVILENQSYTELKDVLFKHGINEIDRALFDLGLSSNQIDESGRGFSFQKDEPLLMTFTDEPKKSEITAKDVVNSWKEETLAQIFWGFGNEKYARRIAKKIAEVREKKKINSTFELVGIIKSALPANYKRGKIHFATKVFQALRIAVNDELNTAKTGLEEAFNFLTKGGELLVISFHESEDRIVKHFMKDKENAGVGVRIYKKPITPSEFELSKNPRSRSAKLRLIKKL